MNNKLSKYTICVLLISALFYFESCSPKRDLVYFSDLGTGGSAALNQKFEAIEPTIHSNDLLSIYVSTLSPESNALFNNPVPNTPQMQQQFGYRVDEDGYISFPGINKLYVKGLTINQAKDKLVKELSLLTKNPNVSISFLNFRVTVLGEVARPGTFNVTNNDITVFEALGLAGDMTAFGKRENVMVIRQKDGQREIVHLNFNKSETLNSKYFYLQQNDVVYVEPDKAKALSINQNNRYIPIISASLSVIAVTISRFFLR